MKLSNKFNLAARLRLVGSRGAMATMKELLLQTFDPSILVIITMPIQHRDDKLNPWCSLKGIGGKHEFV